MTNKEIMAIAMRQSAIDINAAAADFLNDKNVFVKSGVGSLARKYYQEPIACNLVSYGNNIVASVKDEYKEIVKEYLEKFEWYHCFETPNMHWLDEKMKEQGQRVCFMAEYFLPDVNVIKRLQCNYQLKVLSHKDFEELYLPIWSNALCDDMWQIGVDVLPEYRRQGVASSLTSNLAIEILDRGKVPFYCCAWSNIKSVKNAIRSGLMPAWVEMTVKPASVVEKMNQ